MENDKIKQTEVRTLSELAFEIKFTNNKTEVTIWTLVLFFYSFGNANKDDSAAIMVAVGSTSKRMFQRKKIEERLCLNVGIFSCINVSSTATRPVQGSFWKCNRRWSNKLRLCQTWVWVSVSSGDASMLRIGHMVTVKQPVRPNWSSFRSHYPSPHCQVQNPKPLPISTTR